MDTLVLWIAVLSFVLAVIFSWDMNLSGPRRGGLSMADIHAMQERLATPGGYAEARHARIVRDRISLICAGIGILSILISWAI